MRHDDCKGYSSGCVFSAFVMGGIVGAGVALLLTPQSGTETRKKIEELADDVKEKAADYAGTAKEKVVSTVDKAKELYEEKKAPSLQPLQPARKHTKKKSHHDHA